MESGESSAEGVEIAVILAGGSGSRFDGNRHKLLTPFRGRPLITWGLEAAAGTGLLVVLVTGSLDDELRELVGDSVSVLHNPNWRRGMATSLAVAIGEARRRQAKAITVGPGDQPMIPPSAWRAVASSPATIAVAAYDGRRANPVRLSEEVWPLLSTEGDQGARRLIEMRPDLVTEVACAGNPADIDTREDLQRWNSSTNSP